MTRNRRSVAASCGLALCALVTTSVTAGSAPAAGGLVKRCGKVAAGFSLTRMDTADGAHLIGAQRGSGRIGIVFVHQSGGDLCGWLPYAKTLADGRHVVLAINLRGINGSTFPPASSDGLRVDRDIAAATAHLRGGGATRIVLVGASAGGAAVVAGSGIIDPPVDGLVSLSGLATYPKLDVEGAAAKLRVPALFAASKDDTTFATAAHKLATLAKDDPAAKLLILNGTLHGWDLLDPAQPTSRRVDRAVRAVIFAANHP